MLSSTLKKNTLCYLFHLSTNGKQTDKSAHQLLEDLTFLINWYSKHHFFFFLNKTLFFFLTRMHAEPLAEKNGAPITGTSNSHWKGYCHRKIQTIRFIFPPLLSQYTSQLGIYFSHFIHVHRSRQFPFVTCKANNSNVYTTEMPLYEISQLNYEFNTKQRKYFKSSNWNHFLHNL